MQQTDRTETLESVAVILERELAFTIKEWLRRVNLVPALTIIPVSYTHLDVYKRQPQYRPRFTHVTIRQQ